MTEAQHVAPELRESLVEYQEAKPHDGSDGPISPKNKHQPAGKKPGNISEILQAVLPPRTFLKNDGTPMLQEVSTKVSSREDVINLQMKLDEKLQERQARDSGICPVREDLYSQCFDELIRQVTIESPERGLLLLRTRDEVRMTIAAYQTLYQSSITFGMRKTLQAEQGTAGLLARMAELDLEKARLQAALADQKGLYDSIEKRIAERRAIDDKKVQEEKEFLKNQAQHLEKFLQDNLTP